MYIYSKIIIIIIFYIHDFLTSFVFKAQNQLNVKNSKFKINEFKIAILLVVYMHIILTPFVSTIMYEHMGILFRHDMDTKYVMHTFGAYKQNNISK
jgi:hypothetical protein